MYVYVHSLALGLVALPQNLFERSVAEVLKKGRITASAAGLGLSHVRLCTLLRPSLCFLVLQPF